MYCAIDFLEELPALKCYLATRFKSSTDTSTKLKHSIGPTSTVTSTYADTKTSATSNKLNIDGPSVLKNNGNLFYINIPYLIYINYL